MHADDVIQNMVLKYGNCQTYQDLGRVEGGQGITTFKTYFVRPNKFRFDWIYEDRGSNSIWSDGLKVFSRHSSKGELEEEPDLSMAIAGATGVSQGTAHTVPTLLMPDLEVSLSSQTLLKRFPDEFWESEIESDDNVIELFGKKCDSICHRVRSTKANNQADLWIRMSDYALVKCIEERTSTQEDDERTLAALSRIDRAAWEEMRQYLSTRSDEARHSVTSSRYQQIFFDASIDEEIFDGLD